MSKKERVLSEHSPPDPAVTPRPQPAPERAPTVLLVEDEDTVRELACRMLERAGYRVLAAPNGREALEVFAACRQQVDLMVTDVVMPEMRGVELARRVAELSPALPVLYMSGYTGDSIGPELTESASFLQKPFTLAQFLGAVERTLSSGTA